MSHVLSRKVHKCQASIFRVAKSFLSNVKLVEITA